MKRCPPPPAASAFISRTSPTPRSGTNPVDDREVESLAGVTDDPHVPGLHHAPAHRIERVRLPASAPGFTSPLMPGWRQDPRVGHASAVLVSGQGGGHVRPRPPSANGWLLWMPRTLRNAAGARVPGSPPPARPRPVCFGRPNVLAPRRTRRCRADRGASGVAGEFAALYGQVLALLATPLREGRRPDEALWREPGGPARVRAHHA